MNSTVSMASTPSSTTDLKKFIQVKESAIAKEKVINRWRTVAIVIMGLIISVGLAILSDAALSHSIFLGGVGLTVMITAVQYYKNQSERKIRQLRQEQQLLTKQIKKKMAIAADREIAAQIPRFKKQSPVQAPLTSKLSADKGTFLAKPEEIPGLQYVDGINIPLHGG